MHGRRGDDRVLRRRCMLVGRVRARDGGLRREPGERLRGRHRDGPEELRRLRGRLRQHERRAVVRGRIVRVCLHGALCPLPLEHERRRMRRRHEHGRQQLRHVRERVHSRANVLARKVRLRSVDLRWVLQRNVVPRRLLPHLRERGHAVHLLHELHPERRVQREQCGAAARRTGERRAPPASTAPRPGARATRRRAARVAARGRRARPHRPGPPAARAVTPAARATRGRTSAARGARACVEARASAVSENRAAAARARATRARARRSATRAAARAASTRRPTRATAAHAATNARARNARTGHAGRSRS